MKKLLSLILAMVMLMSFAACDTSEEAKFIEPLEILLDGYPVELFGEMLNTPMVIGENAEVIGDGSMIGNTEEQSLKWQAELDKLYKDAAEPGTVVDVNMGTDLMAVWMQMVINGATFELKELEITEVMSDTKAAYSAVITVTQKGGGTADATFSGTVQLNEKCLVNYLQISSLDEVYEAIGMDLRWR